MPAPVTLPEIIRAALDARLEGVFTAMPGKVTAYHNDTQTADVQPMVKHVTQDSDGSPVYEDLPVLPDVPVVFPRGGGYVITVPLAAGDFVWLQFSHTSTAEFRSNGQVGEPADPRRHSAGYPVALPGVAPDSGALSASDASARLAGLLLGKDGGPEQIRFSTGTIALGAGATDHVALAAILDSFVNNFIAWTPAPNDGGAALKAKIVAWLATLPGGAFTTVGSSLLKAK